MGSRIAVFCWAALVVSALEPSRARAAGSAEFKLFSDDLGPDRPLAQNFVYSGYGCRGGNQSPSLSWAGAPHGTRGFAVVLFDPDAMQGRGFLHWLMINISAEIHSLDRDAGKTDGSKMPSGAMQLRNGFRMIGYGGLCPPLADAPHTYRLTVYALNTNKIALPANVSSLAMLEAIEGSAIAKSSIAYRFGRNSQ